MLGRRLGRENGAHISQLGLVQLPAGVSGLPLPDLTVLLLIFELIHDIVVPDLQILVVAEELSDEDIPVVIRLPELGIAGLESLRVGEAFHVEGSAMAAIGRITGLKVGADSRWSLVGRRNEEGGRARVRVRLVLEAACLLMPSFARGGRYNLRLGT